MLDRDASSSAIRLFAFWTLSRLACLYSLPKSRPVTIQAQVFREDSKRGRHRSRVRAHLFLSPNPTDHQHVSPPCVFDFLIPARSGTLRSNEHPPARNNSRPGFQQGRGRGLGNPVVIESISLHASNPDSSSKAPKQTPLISMYGMVWDGMEWYGLDRCPVRRARYVLTR